VRPNVLGKFDEVEGDHTGGEWSMPNPSAHHLLRANADLNPSIIARAIAKRLRKLGLPEDVQARIDAQLAILAAQEQSMQTLLTQGVEGAERQPWFCSGCPHNTSTRVPEGSRAMAGIGCHFMAIWMDRDTVGFTQMGGEGVPWVGQQPFSNDRHMFANLGDGTYFHSGLLAVRQSIAAGVNITYKILYNDAVAMTGGQQVGERPEGHSVVQIAQSMRAEGAVKITIVTDEPEKYAGVSGLPEGIAIQHRDTLDEVQRAFREIQGTTVIIYDQTCATEKRRRRKRGTLVEPTERVVINELVCEGCGDCSVQSNCLSVEPLETEFGRKRTINQSSCNKDFSCVKGFCPSFVTVDGGRLRKNKPGAAQAEWQGDVPEPVLPRLGAGDTPAVWGTIVAGVGGTGVITIGQLLGMAAHIEGKGIVTQDAAGLAQKGGATWSHVLIGATQDDIRTTRVSNASADLVLGCDPIVAANKETWARLRAGRSHVALNASATPTAAFVKDPGWQNPAQACVDALVSHLGEAAVGVFDAEHAATRLMGDSIYTNPMMLGYAWQKGWVPLGHEALMRAIELNAVAVENNQRAFEWGRRAAHDPQAFAALQSGGGAQVIQFKPRESVTQLIARRVEFLTGYQNARYAADYQQFVERVRKAEAPLGRSELTAAVARYLFKLMAYKDEYEVARLHSDPAFHARLASQFEGDYKLRVHLAPPLLAKKNAKGELIKQAYGPAMFTAFRWLARFKGLRGTALDIFGRSEERRTERALIGEYRSSIEALLPDLDAGNHALALEIARLPEQIKGFGHVKERNLAATRSRWAALNERWHQGETSQARVA
jgi:indolepyruvate ferredoxin oxidoreductase